MHDVSVRVWDVTRPWLPVLTFEEQKDVVTGIFWTTDSKRSIYSCSKDGTVIRHAVEDALEPIMDATARSHGICWNPRGGLAKFDIVAPELTTSQPQSATQVTASKYFLMPAVAKEVVTPVTPTVATLSTLKVIPECDPSLLVMGKIKPSWVFDSYLLK